ncbi:MAG: TfoX/Sxy family protein [Lentisphaeria bacterium]|jgi:DNA transformation protein|nr:TfoX/Sxy family protein [Lentisphaeria bacterium]
MNDRGETLADLPNIGREVARLLVAAGISTPQELRELGAVAAAGRIRRIRPQDPPCRSMLAGLEGAIRGVRWHLIPKDEREALWREYVRTAEESPR